MSCCQGFELALIWLWAGVGSIPVKLLGAEQAGRALVREQAYVSLRLHVLIVSLLRGGLVRLPRATAAVAAACRTRASWRWLHGLQAGSHRARAFCVAANATIYVRGSSSRVRVFLCGGAV
jgi:hypothetical protein